MNTLFKVSSAHKTRVNRFSMTGSARSLSTVQFIKLILRFKYLSFLYILYIDFHLQRVHAVVHQLRQRLPMGPIAQLVVHCSDIEQVRVEIPFRSSLAIA